MTRIGLIVAAMSIAGCGGQFVTGVNCCTCLGVNGPDGTNYSFETDNDFVAANNCLPNDATPPDLNGESSTCGSDSVDGQIRTVSAACLDVCSNQCGNAADAGIDIVVTGE